MFVERTLWLYVVLIYSLYTAIVVLYSLCVHSDLVALYSSMCSFTSVYVYVYVYVNPSLRSVEGLVYVWVETLWARSLHLLYRV